MTQNRKHEILNTGAAITERNSGEYTPLLPHPPSTAELNRYIARGERLRAEAFGRAISQAIGTAAAAVRRLGRAFRFDSGAVAGAERRARIPDGITDGAMEAAKALFHPGASWVRHEQRGPVGIALCADTDSQAQPSAEPGAEPGAEKRRHHAA